MLLFMKQYGKVILLVLVSVLVFGVLTEMRVGGNKGFIRIIYGEARKEVRADDGKPTMDLEAVMSYAARKAPQIIYSSAKAVCREAVDVTAMFAASDAEGNDTAVIILDILDESQNSIFCQGKDEGASFVFPSAGVYTVIVKAADRENKKSLGRYRLLVAAG